MTGFITTIQLHKANDQDYETLNTEMEKASFHRKKTHHKTPGICRGEYNTRKNISLKEVADAVYRAVKKTGRDYSFTIIKNKTGLQQA